MEMSIVYCSSCIHAIGLCSSALLASAKIRKGASIHHHYRDHHTASFRFISCPSALPPGSSASPSPLHSSHYQCTRSPSLSASPPSKFPYAAPTSHYGSQSSLGGLSVPLRRRRDHRTRLCRFRGRARVLLHPLPHRGLC